MGTLNKTWNRRQFDVTFKMSVVRAVQQFRREGAAKGTIKSFLTSHKITRQHVNYWEKQFDEGHFSPFRAVAFSRRSVMVHG